MSTSWQAHRHPEELGTIPPDIEVRSWVPQRAMLEQAGAFVTHAGMGGCGEGLLAGMPMIAVPRGAGQFVNADRLVELGVARRVDTADTTAETLRTVLNDLVTDPERIARSRQLQAAVRCPLQGRHPTRRRPHREPADRLNLCSGREETLVSGGICGNAPAGSTPHPAKPVAASCVRRTWRGCLRPPDHRGEGGAERAHTERVHRREPGQP